MRYIPHTDNDIARMLEVVGVRSIDQLFAELIPPALQLGRALDLPPALDEHALTEHLSELAQQNLTVGKNTFLGAGIYPHVLPAAVDMLLLRAEFYTSYTPYQPEISQGTLQAIFEYQTMVGELVGLPLANASMYDGSTAAAEAVLMARRLTGRTRAIASRGLHPEYRRVISTYLHGLGAELEEVPFDTEGRLDVHALEGMLGADVGAVVVQAPNFFGVVQDIAQVAKAAHAHGALCIAVVTDPVALGLLAPPGVLGADIAVGEGIGLAIPPSLGGPGLGLFAARDDAEYRKAIPGRLVGETVDRHGRRGYVLTLATREQHIRRERATSNICTNTGLVALAFTIHMSMLGRRGLRQMAQLTYSNGQYARDAILALPGFTPRFAAPTFGEFAVRVPGGAAERVVERALERGVLAGLACGRLDPAYADTLLVSVSEIHRKADLDRLVSVLREVTP